MITLQPEALDIACTEIRAYIEFAAHVAPAGHLDQQCVVARPRWPVEFAEARVAIGVQEASAGTEQRLGMLRLAVRRVAIDRGGRYTRTPRALVAYHRPEPPGSGSAQAGCEHGDSGVISVQNGAGED